MSVRDTEGNAVCSPQRPLKCKKAAITAANLHVEGVTSERERKNKDDKNSLHNLPGKHVRRIEVQLSFFLYPRRQMEVDGQRHTPAALSPDMTQ
jgi:hypothetical protein